MKTILFVIAACLLAAACSPPPGAPDPRLTNGSPHARATCNKQQFPQCGGN